MGLEGQGALGARVEVERPDWGVEVKEDQGKL